MKLLIVFLVIFWINGQHLTEAREEDKRFFEYSECITTSTKSLLFGRTAPEYDALNFQYNKYYPKAYPIAIFTPKSTSDVQTAVKCGVKTKLQLVPISGGHSYAGLSYGTNDSILIDFRHMRNISLDLTENVVTVEPGVMFGHLYYYLMKEGLMVPVGSCMTVAAGGYIIGGGLGHFSSHFGLAIDSVVEINMVDASGNALLVDKNHNTKLWWAMRGVGPGYIGLLTSVKMEVKKLSDFNFVHMIIRFRNDNFKNFMENYIKWLYWMSENEENKYLSSVVTIHGDNETGVKSIELDRRGIVVEIIKVRNSTMTNSYPSFISKAMEFLVAQLEFQSFEVDSNRSFIDLLARISYSPKKKYHERLDIDENLQFFSTVYRGLSTDEGFQRDVKSFFIKKPAIQKLNATNLKEIQKRLLEMPDNNSIIIDYEGGKIGEIGINETAYVHRDNFINIEISAITMNQNQTEYHTNAMWLKNFHESVKFLDSGSTYQNYPDLSFSANNSYSYLKRYYGSNLEGLIEVKRKWDPNHYFNSQMSLPIMHDNH